jgi:hypothetical protein
MDSLVFWFILFLGILVFFFMSIFLGIFIIVISIFFLYPRNSGPSFLVEEKGKKKVVTVIEGDKEVEMEIVCD